MSLAFLRRHGAAAPTADANATPAGGRLMVEITRILEAIDEGDAHAAEELLPLVYDELRRLAAQKLSHEKPGQTLQAGRNSGIGADSKIMGKIPTR